MFYCPTLGSCLVGIGYVKVQFYPLFNLDIPLFWVWFDDEFQTKEYQV